MSDDAGGEGGTAKDRIVLLDAVRGLAVLGILICNAPDFAYAPLLAESPWASPHGLTAGNLTVWAVVQTLFQQRFYTLFSMMFGVSMLLVGGDVVLSARSWILAKRLLWLIPIGLFHGFVVWWGDVLFVYAVAGLFVFGYRSQPPWRLIGIGVAIFVILEVMQLIPAIGNLAHPRIGPPPNLVAMKAKALQAAAGFSADALASLKANIAQELILLGFSLSTVLQSACLMLIGMGLFKLGLFTGDAPRSAYLALVAAGVFCLALVALGVTMALVTGRGNSGAWRTGFILQTICAPVISLSYLAGLALALKSRWLAWFPRLLAPAGQMAFTNYITQSLIMTAIFYGGRGLGLFGKLDMPELAAITAAIWALQIAWSHAWLRAFDMGPLEWGWRFLYRGPKRLRRLMPAPEVVPA